MQINNVEFEDYQVYLKEKSRPPSRGGNTKALHQHVIVIGGERFSFLYNGSQKWAHKGDTVSFDYSITDSGYRNIDSASFRTLDKNGDQVVRGTRGVTKKLRTATQRAPGGRRDR